MHTYYQELISGMPGEPLWFDEAAVPRYLAFSPLHAWNIYAREALLFEIRCQACETPFAVLTTWPARIRYGEYDEVRSLAERIAADAIHYGDPPNTQCCEPGPTMNSVPVRVIEFWQRTEQEKTRTLAGINPLTHRERWDAAYKTLSHAAIMGWDRNFEFDGLSLHSFWDERQRTGA